jgi:hypothetical protein
MKYVEVITGASSTNTVIAVAQKEKSYDTRLGVEDGNGLQKIRMLVDDDRLQSLLDTLQNIMGWLAVLLILAWFIFLRSTISLD